MNLSKDELLNLAGKQHKLTHQTLYISFWKLEINSPIINGVKISDIHNYPFPVPIKNFINNFINTGN